MWTTQNIQRGQKKANWCLQLILIYALSTSPNQEIIRQTIDKISGELSKINLLGVSLCPKSQSIKTVVTNIDKSSCDMNFLHICNLNTICLSHHLSILVID